MSQMAEGNPSIMAAYEGFERFMTIGNGNCSHSLLVNGVTAFISRFWIWTVFPILAE